MINCSIPLIPAVTINRTLVLVVLALVSYHVNNMHDVGTTAQSPHLGVSHKHAVL
jgi:hypothetical protein